ncbi:hypothetical protein ACHZ97_14675 [Lysobacter soli]|uniref:hypothetical protein n=1 Tax=Lysobacter soli TaxID=453783 RepID=UPI0037C50C9A
MTVDLEPKGDGRSHFVLGPVEKWVAGAIAAACIALAYWLVSSVQTLVTQAAVTNTRLSDLSQQLTDVPELRRQVVELKVRVDKHDAEISELRTTRNLK